MSTVYRWMRARGRVQTIDTGLLEALCEAMDIGPGEVIEFERKQAALSIGQELGPTIGTGPKEVWRGGAMVTLEQLRELAERLPDGAALTLSKAALLEALGPVTDSRAADATPPSDLTVSEIAARFHRSPSTVRGWLEAGRFEGAYKLNGRDWRVPLGAVEDFVASEQARHVGRSAGLGAWRRHRR